MMKFWSSIYGCAEGGDAEGTKHPLPKFQKFVNGLCDTDYLLSTFFYYCTNTYFFSQRNFLTIFMKTASFKGGSEVIKKLPSCSEFVRVYSYEEILIRNSVVPIYSQGPHSNIFTGVLINPCTVLLRYLKVLQKVGVPKYLWWFLCKN